METKDDISYGVIPMHYSGGTWNVFLIRQYGSTGDVYWTFPKGHPETTETPSQCAVREFKEETGMELKELYIDREYTQEYSFRYEDVMINKKVVYYLGVVADPAFTIQEDEVQEAGWFARHEALARLTYEPARALFETVINDLQ